ncbi:MAG TPA: HTH domain-containing protein [Bacteroidia bacterium]|nr:HTH domain-containing protein [Bacteroidia bacterium]
MNLQEAILKSLEEIGKPVSTEDLYNYIIKKNYYEFSGETPKNTLSSRLGDFIRKGDIRVKREKINNAFYYSLTKNEDTINDEGLNENKKIKMITLKKRTCIFY